MREAHSPRGRSWPRKFRDAFRGVIVGVRAESSFAVHLFMTVAVVVAAVIAGASLTEWCLLLLCIFGVLTAELLNTAIERLAKFVHAEQHPDMRDCLDVSSGTVLVAALGAAIVGLLILVPRLWAVLANMLGQ